jgi:hypothetical protein
VIEFEAVDTIFCSDEYELFISESFFLWDIFSESLVPEDLMVVRNDNPPASQSKPSLPPWIHNRGSERGVSTETARTQSWSCIVQIFQAPFPYCGRFLRTVEIDIHLCEDLVDALRSVSWHVHIP